MRIFEDFLWSQRVKMRPAIGGKKSSVLSPQKCSQKLNLRHFSRENLNICTLCIKFRNKSGFEGSPQLVPACTYLIIPELNWHFWAPPTFDGKICFVQGHIIGGDAHHSHHQAEDEADHRDQIAGVTYDCWNGGVIGQNAQPILAQHYNALRKVACTALSYTSTSNR